jgi:hypothetical protein
MMDAEHDSLLTPQMPLHADCPDHLLLIKLTTSEYQYDGYCSTMAIRIMINPRLVSVYIPMRLICSTNYVLNVLLNLRRNTHNLQVKLISKHHREGCKYEGMSLAYL